ncbi:MAG: DNA polymerase I [Anaerolineae bacterium]|nr:DNA polymerase I [Anaerolineae bacterium]
MADGKLVLVDGHSLAYRAFHALPLELQTSQGELTNAVYGFATMLFSVLEEETPDFLIVTFDKGPSFRTRRFADYKAHRERMPDEMRAQMPRVRELVERLGVPIVELEDYEADDLLGTLSRQAAEQGLAVVIVTGDRDALQLVDEHVTVLTSGRQFSDTRRFTPQRVQERYGLKPEQLIDLKALMGDKSDNIPGVRGVGEKGATGLLQDYGSLDAIFAHLDVLPTRYRNALEKGRDAAYLSQELGRIVRDVPVDLDLAAAARWRTVDRRSVLELLHQLEFRSLVSRVLDLPGQESEKASGQLSLFDAELLEGEASPAPAYHLIPDVATLRRVVEELRQTAHDLSIDTETTGTDAMLAALVGISFSYEAGSAWYVPVLAPPGEPRLRLPDLHEILGPVLADASLSKRGHNLKYDLKVLRRAGLPLEGVAFDTMIAEWVINPSSPNLGLKNMAWARLGVRMTEISELIGSGSAQKTMDQVPLREVAPYASADADLTHRLVTVLEPELVDHQQLDLFRDLEMPLIPVLASMEMLGVRLDAAYLQRLSEDLANRLGRLENEIHTEAGEQFNINSTQQLSAILFDKLALPTQGMRKLKSGFYSTRAEVLEGLRGVHPVVDHILAYRELAKLKSTYVDALPALVNPETGRVHTSYRQTGTVTGRLSSVNPNLQNIPIRTEEGRRVRHAFIAEEGWQLVGADYSQVELRVMAHISEDSGLIGAFQRGEDVHASTAAAVFDVPLTQVTYDMRRIAKAVNFGLIYGQSAYGLSSQIGVAPEKAQDFIDRYFARFPRVRDFMQRIQGEAEKRGYVETLLRRRRYFPELESGSKASYNQRQAALRMAINAPIQGTAADIIKLAMLKLHARLAAERLRSRMILQVHDELVLEAPDDEAARVCPLMREEMEGAFELCVPLKVDVEIGANWGDMAPWKG